MTFQPRYLFFVLVYDIPDPYTEYEDISKRSWKSPRLPPIIISSLESEPEPDDDDDALEFLRNYQNDLAAKVEEQPELTLQDLQELYPFVQYLSDLHLSIDDVRNLLLPENDQALQNLLEDFDDRERAYDTDVIGFLRDQLENDEFTPEKPSFRVNYNTPSGFRSGWESRDDLDLNDLPESRVYVEDDEDQPDDHKAEDGSGEETEPEEEIFRELKQLHQNEKVDGLAHKFDRNGGLNGQSGVYTEGGVVYVPDSQIMGKAQNPKKP